MHFNMSSKICFNLDQSKILLSSNGLIYGTEITTCDASLQYAF